MAKPFFTVDSENLTLLTVDVGTGRIVELTAQDAGLLAKHIPVQADTLFVAASGVDLSGTYGVFQQASRQVAVEWVRHESKPKANEPECNIYRYLFGVTQDGRCVGMAVTERMAGSDTGQVGDHWTTLDEVIRRYVS